MNDRHQEHTRRDAETQFLLGGFVFILSLPVLAGTLWAETSHQAIVNVCAGLALFALGVGFCLYGWLWLKRLK